MIDKLWYRSRGLDQMDEKFGKRVIADFIRKRMKTQKEVRILELGFGEGKCLIDLRAMFPDKKVKLYGVNDVKKGHMHSRSDFKKNAKKFGININELQMPYSYFYDAGHGLNFDSNYFDVIISQTAFQYVGDKAKLIEEFWRVLKIDGKAFVQIDNRTYKTDPDFMRINSETPRWIVYSGNKIIRLGKVINKIRKKGYGIKFDPARNYMGSRIILINKNRVDLLKFGLKYDKESTIDLNKLAKKDVKQKDHNIWWGKRSVYHII